MELPDYETCSDYRPLLEKYDWDVEMAMAIMEAESGCNYKVVNWKDIHSTCVGSSGLFQIACLHAPIEEMKDPKANIQKAHELYKAKGWTPWTTYTKGNYKRFLKQTN